MSNWRNPLIKKTFNATSSRILLLFSLIVFISVLISVSGYLLQSRQHAIESAVQDARNMAHEQALLLGENLSNTEAILTQLELQLNVKHRLHDHQDLSIHDLLRNFRNLFPSAIELLLIDRQGSVVATSNSILAHVDLSIYCAALIPHHKQSHTDKLFTYSPQRIAQCPTNAALVYSRQLKMNGDTLWLFLLQDNFRRVLDQKLRSLSPTASFKINDNRGHILLSSLDIHKYTLNSNSANSSAMTAVEVNVMGADLTVHIDFSEQDILERRWWPAARMTILLSFSFLLSWLLISYFIIRLAHQYQHTLAVNEQRFRSLFEDAPNVAVQGYDSQRRVIFWNKASEILYGYTNDEAMGRQLEDLILPEEVRQETIASINDWLQDGPAIPSKELTLKRKDGSLVSTFSTFALQTGNGGTEIFSIDVDLTERKQAEAELERYRIHLEERIEERTRSLALAMERIRMSDERFEFALEATNDGIWDWNLQTDFSYINAAYSKMLGFSPGELGSSAQTQFVDLLPPEEQKSLLEQTKHLLETEGGHEMEFRLRCKDGSYKWILSRGKVVTWDSEGHPLRAVGTHVDLTIRKQIEIELRETKAAAEIASVAKSSFLANMSHEIRTPMNAIIGFAHLTSKHSQDPKVIENQEKIITGGLHLLSIINDILDLSKIEAGKFTLESAPLRLEAIVTNVIAMLNDRATDKGLALVSMVQPYTCHFIGDATRLQQALLNYASNAIKFTETGSIIICVFTLEENDESALIRFEVTDNGIGIAENALPRLFSSFEQADNSTTRKYGGTGLGLAITQKIAQLMGGEAGAESEPGVGSTFWFTVRLLKSDALAQAEQPSATESAETVLKQKYAGYQVLVAEDEPVNREITTFMLEDVGLTVFTAEDGLEAVKMATHTPYDLILMDMQMPNMDGLDATRSIRQLPHYADTPIIAMTANAFSEDRVRCLAAGMNDFITKPVPPDALYTMLLKALNSRDIH